MKLINVLFLLFMSLCRFAYSMDETMEIELDYEFLANNASTSNEVPPVIAKVLAGPTLLAKIPKEIINLIGPYHMAKTWTDIANCRKNLEQMAKEYKVEKPNDYELLNMFYAFLNAPEKIDNKTIISLGLYFTLDKCDLFFIPQDKTKRAEYNDFNFVEKKFAARAHHYSFAFHGGYQSSAETEWCEENVSYSKGYCAIKGSFLIRPSSSCAEALTLTCFVGGSDGYDNYRIFEVKGLGYYIGSLAKPTQDEIYLCLIDFLYNDKNRFKLGYYAHKEPGVFNDYKKYYRE